MHIERYEKNQIQIETLNFVSNTDHKVSRRTFEGYASTHHKEMAPGCLKTVILHRAFSVFIFVKSSTLIYESSAKNSLFSRIESTVTNTNTLIRIHTDKKLSFLIPRKNTSKRTHTQTHAEEVRVKTILCISKLKLKK